ISCQRCALEEISHFRDADVSVHVYGLDLFSADHHGFVLGRRDPGGDLRHRLDQCVAQQKCSRGSACYSLQKLSAIAHGFLLIGPPDWERSARGSITPSPVAHKGKESADRPYPDYLTGVV